MAKAQSMTFFSISISRAFCLIPPKKGNSTVSSMGYVLEALKLLIQSGQGGVDNLWAYLLSIEFFCDPFELTSAYAIEKQSVSYVMTVPVPLAIFGPFVSLSTNLSGKVLSQETLL